MSKNLFARVTDAITGKLTSDVIRRRVEHASAALAEAERSWRLAAVAAEAGGPPEDEARAEEHLASCRRELERLNAVLAEVEAQEAQEVAAARLKQEAAEDAKLAKASTEWARTAAALAEALSAYADAYGQFVRSSAHMSLLARTNPRARQDLSTQNVDALVGTELARLSSDTIPPGADRWAASALNPREIVPLVGHVSEMANAIKEGLRHGS
ncbi:hypothetical protein [Phenylobacterium sp.]|uniref:hypothetical protein n=1 Tax=Phenylobacterium sp. TaxID=1871053 RepID=UPI0035B171D4